MRQTVANIIRETAEKYRVPVAGLMGQRRTHEYAHPRQEAYFRVFTECPHISYPEAGRRIGGRDHTTILHGVRKHCERIGMTYDGAKALRYADHHAISFAAAIASFGQTMKTAMASPEAASSEFIRAANAFGSVMKEARSHAC